MQKMQPISWLVSLFFQPQEDAAAENRVETSFCQTPCGLESTLMKIKLTQNDYMPLRYECPNVYPIRRSAQFMRGC